MNSETRFVEAIKAAPQDPAVRFAYADWLEERNDPRAELIRIEEEMRALPVFSDRFWELKPRRRELREEAAADWVQSMGYAPTYHPLFSKLPTRPNERWRLIEEFIEFWHQPLGPQSGNTEEGIKAAEMCLQHRLPAALRQWYLLAGKQTKIWSRQDQLYCLGELEIKNERLIFRCENQGCEIWGVRLEDFGLEDPPVWKFGDKTAVECPTVTEFAIISLLLETMWGGGGILFSNDAGNLEKLMAEISQSFVRCDLPTSYWALDPVRFYEGRDIYFVESEADGFLYMRARNESAVQELSPTLRQYLSRL